MKKPGRKFILVVFGVVVLVAVIPLMKWAMGGALPEGFAIPWLSALVALLTQYGVTNVVAKRTTNGSDPTMGVPG